MVVVGAYGAGKTTLARRLGEAAGLPVYHIDAGRWAPGWVLRPRDEWLRELDAVLAGDGWIVDGNFEATLDRRLAACDTAIFLDFPPLLSAWRVFRRRVSRAHRPDLPDGVVERLNLQLLRLLLDYRRTVRRELARLLDEHASHVDVIVVRNRAQAAQLVDRIAAQCQPRANDSRLHT